MLTFYFLGIKQQGHEAECSPPSSIMLKCVELYPHSPHMSSWHAHRQLSLVLNSVISHTLHMCVCVHACARMCARNCGSACDRYQNQGPKHYTTIDKDIKLSKFWITIMCT